LQVLNSCVYLSHGPTATAAPADRLHQRPPLEGD
jgi:hypothetical protein